jgi:sugar/nucleoside kinase (ribokinase family)
MGGAGLYAALGARLAAGSKHAAAVSFIIDKGSDFPTEFQDLIQSWTTSVRFRTDGERLTTRAWNGYGPNQHRGTFQFQQVESANKLDFRYLTPKRRLEVDSLTDAQALASTFHMVCSPVRCITLVRDLHVRRANLSSSSPSPIVIWEPIPDLCTPAEVDNLREAATCVDVISPNGEELADFFTSSSISMDRSEMVASLLAKCGPSPKQAIVVRDGADGSRLYMDGRTVHFKAHHQDGSKVIDPTGGGNTYLGGLAMGLSTLVCPSAAETISTLGVGSRNLSARWSTMLNAVAHATVTASFAIEQVGLPFLDGNTQDFWNGTLYAERFNEYLCREKIYLLSQIETSRLA